MIPRTRTIKFTHTYVAQLISEQSVQKANNYLRVPQALIRQFVFRTRSFRTSAKTLAVLAEISLGFFTSPSPGWPTFGHENHGKRKKCLRATLWIATRVGTLIVATIYLQLIQN